MKQRTQYESPSPTFENKVFSFADIAEGETDTDDADNIESPIGFVFL